MIRPEILAISACARLTDYDIQVMTSDELLAWANGNVDALEDVIRRLNRIIRRQTQLRQALPNELAWALWETRAYHRTTLTGRCGV
jgi:hypothetical protein